MTRIENRQAALCLSDQELCAAVGFDREIVWTMIKSGNMRLPLRKIPELARTLSFEAGPLLRAAMDETSPGLLQLIKDVFDPLELTECEQRLVKHLRHLAGDKATGPIVFDGKGVIALIAV